LSEPSEIYNKRHWYIAHEILYFETTAQEKQKRAKLTVWENLVLITGRTPDEAYKKALHRGRLNRHKLKIHGADGYCKFKGLKDLVLIYDQIQDGSELEWHEMKMSKVDLKRIIKRKTQMHAFNAGPTKARTLKEPRRAKL
jgi:Domain of unknown function (DUF4288)